MHIEQWLFENGKCYVSIVFSQETGALLVCTDLGMNVIRNKLASGDTALLGKQIMVDCSSLHLGRIVGEETGRVSKCQPKALEGGVLIFTHFLIFGIGSVLNVFMCSWGPQN